MCENISIDFAVLERAPNVVGFPAADIGWNDVGSWNAVYELQPRDSNANSGGDVLVESSTGNYVDAEKLVALLGVNDLIVIDTPGRAADRRSQPRPAGRRSGETPRKGRPPRVALAQSTLPDPNFFPGQQHFSRVVMFSGAGGLAACRGSMKSKKVQSAVCRLGFLKRLVQDRDRLIRFLLRDDVWRQRA